MDSYLIIWNSSTFEYKFYITVIEKEKSKQGEITIFKIKVEEFTSKCYLHVEDNVWQEISELPLEYK